LTTARDVVAAAQTAPGRVLGQMQTRMILICNDALISYAQTKKFGVQTCMDMRNGFRLRGVQPMVGALRNAHYAASEKRREHRSAVHGDCALAW
jgi:hypothetical protein